MYELSQHTIITVMAAVAETTLSESEDAVTVNNTVSQHSLSNVTLSLEEDSAFYDRPTTQEEEHNDDHMTCLSMNNEASTENSPENESTLPELTHQHLLTVFFDSAITKDNVDTLEILLGIGRARLLSSRSEQALNTSAYHAMEAIIAWVNQHPELSLEKKHEILAGHLRLLKLNNVIPRLRGEERYIETDLQEMTTYLADASKSFSRKQAYKFGRALKFKEDQIDAISQRRETTTGMDIVLRLFDHKNKTSTHLRKSVIDDIHESLLVASGTHNVGQELIDTDSGTEPSSGIRGNLNKSNWRKLKKKVSCLYTLTATLVIAIILSIITTLAFILVLVIYPQSISLPKQVILPTDVVLYTIPSSYWLASINIELEGTAGCSAQVISVECSDLQYYNTSDISYINEFDYLYITQDSSVEFSLSNKASPSYYAWIFNDVQSAMQHSANNFGDLACNHPPEGAWCIKLGDNERFVAPYSSYYFIRCDREPNCTSINSIEVNTREYDFESTQTHEIDSVTIYAHGKDETIKTKRGTFDLRSIENEICLLMTLNEDDCKTKDALQVAITGRGGRYELLVYLIIQLVILIVSITMLIALKLHCRNANGYNFA